MATAVPLLDLTPSSLNIKFQKGSSLNPILFYLGPNLEVVNISGYKAKMQARESYAATAPLTGFELTTENGGLLITQGSVTVPAGTALPNGTVTDVERVVTGAYGVQLNVPPAVTAAVEWLTAVYDCDLLDGSVNIPFVRGTLIPTPELTP